MTNDTYFGTFYVLHHWFFLYKECSIQTELAWPLLYNGDANANSFIEARIVFFFAESPITNV